MLKGRREFIKSRPFPQRPKDRVCDFTKEHRNRKVKRNLHPEAQAETEHKGYQMAKVRPGGPLDGSERERDDNDQMMRDD